VAWQLRCAKVEGDGEGSEGEGAARSRDEEEMEGTWLQQGGGGQRAVALARATGEPRANGAAQQYYRRRRWGQDARMAHCRGEGG
jgi:hypothetical protein